LGGMTITSGKPVRADKSNHQLDVGKGKGAPVTCSAITQPPTILPNKGKK